MCSAHSEAQRLEVVVRRPLAGLLARRVREGHRSPARLRGRRVELVVELVVVVELYYPLARLVALEQERPALN